MANKTPHTVVIGGGVIGGFSAWYLRQTGRDVTLIDKGNLAKHVHMATADTSAPAM